MHHDIEYIQFLFKDFDRLSKRISAISTAVFMLNVKDYRQKELILEMSQLRTEKNSIKHELDCIAHDVWITDQPLNIKSS
jgi:hypothetical protein